MATFKEWDESLKAMDDKTLKDVLKALWTLDENWPLFSKEYKTDLLALRCAAREVRNDRALRLMDKQIINLK